MANLTCITLIVSLISRCWRKLLLTDADGKPRNQILG